MNICDKLNWETQNKINEIIPIIEHIRLAKISISYAER